MIKKWVSSKSFVILLLWSIEVSLEMITPAGYHLQCKNADRSKKKKGETVEVWFVLWS